MRKDLNIPLAIFVTGLGAGIAIHLYNRIKKTIQDLDDRLGNLEILFDMNKNDTDSVSDIVSNDIDQK